MSSSAPALTRVEPSRATWTQNLGAVSREDVPLLQPEELAEETLRLCADGARLVALFAERELWAVVARDDRNALAVLRAALAAPVYPSLTPRLPAAQAFEREIFEQRGLRPEGHPWLKPLRRHAELDDPPRLEEAHLFFQAEGSGLHEVAVGPVHAGIIEPGHFRFQCAGETVLHLEIQLGYQHRGAEALMLGGPAARRLALAESICGDTSVGHAVAHAAAVEALAEQELSLAAQSVRAIALELERLANHIGDLGALCNDVGYLPGASWLGRLRGEFLNMLAVLSGNRFGRGLIDVGGARFAVSSRERDELERRLARLGPEVLRVIDLIFDSPMVLSRFERTGPVSRGDADALGLVGPVARACGCDRDVRRDHPSGLYRFAQVPVSLAETGDVMARALVRRLEVERSLAFLRERLPELPDLPAAAAAGAAAPTRAGRVAVSLVEGWRGEIAHVAMTGEDGQLAAYKIVDPSFHNWFGLALALRGQPISDFPLCNKSFNLSYAGHDL